MKTYRRTVYVVIGDQVIDAVRYTGSADLARHNLERAMEAGGAAWWDAYEERRIVSDILYAGMMIID